VSEANQSSIRSNRFRFGGLDSFPDSAQFPRRKKNPSFAAMKDVCAPDPQSGSLL
jgi:hypothetical protein